MLFPLNNSPPPFYVCRLFLLFRLSTHLSCSVSNITSLQPFKAPEEDRTLGRGGGRGSKWWFGCLNIKNMFFVKFLFSVILLTIMYFNMYKI